jgi:hypothetical protein
MKTAFGVQGGTLDEQLVKRAWYFRGALGDSVGSLTDFVNCFAGRLFSFFQHGGQSVVRECTSRRTLVGTVLRMARAQQEYIMI